MEKTRMQTNKIARRQRKDWFVRRSNSLLLDGIWRMLRVGNGPKGMHEDVGTRKITGKRQIGKTLKGGNTLIF